MKGSELVQWSSSSPHKISQPTRNYNDDDDDDDATTETDKMSRRPVLSHIYQTTATLYSTLMSHPF